MNLAPLVAYDTDPYYQLPKSTLQPQVIEPYLYTGALMTSYIAPIVRHGRFLGIAGDDHLLDSIDAQVKQVHFLKTGYAFLVSNGGIFVSAPDKKAIGGAIPYAWYGYAALIRNANTAAPSIGQTQFTEKPMHYGQICNSGISCTTSGGDRQMADFFGFAVGPDGGLRIVYNDTTNTHDGAGLEAVKQLAGATPTGKGRKGSPASGGVSDPQNDAQWPHYGVQLGTNISQLDLTSAKVTVSGGVATIKMSVATLASLAPPPGKGQAVWLTRFQALAPRDGGSEDVYQILYAGAQSTAGGALSYFAGTTDCTNTTPENCKLFQYPAKVSATGSVSGGTITITVPLATGFGVPVHGTTLYNATAFTFGRDDATADLYADVDATAPFDVPVR